jgi:hypothetical protein
MIPKKMLVIFAQWVALSIIMAILWTVSMSFIPSLSEADTSVSQEGAVRFLLAMIAVSFINTAVVMYPTLRSRWHGIRLIAVVALVVYSVQFFLGGLEAILFRADLKIPIKIVYAQLASGALFALLFAFVAVAVLGKIRKPITNPETPNTRLMMPKGQFMLKFFLLSVIFYPLIYFLFGYFVAWQFPGVREFYFDSAAILPFFEHMRTTLTANPVLPLWQMGRGTLWVLVALPLIRMMKGTAVEVSITVGLIFALVMNSQHLMPNPYMPAMIRFPHFIETASSNFIWGMLITWLMYRSHVSLADLFKKRVNI